jgi:hypothetical protein
MGMTKAFGFFPTIYQEYKQKTPLSFPYLGILSDEHL